MSKINRPAAPDGNIRRLKKKRDDGWASWTIDCGPGRFIHTNLSKLQATSRKPELTSGKQQVTTESESEN